MEDLISWLLPPLTMADLPLLALPETFVTGVTFQVASNRLPETGIMFTFCPSIGPSHLSLNSACNFPTAVAEKWPHGKGPGGAG